MASVFGTIRQNCEIAGETHYRGDGTTRRDEREMKMERGESEWRCVCYVCACTRMCIPRTGAEGSRGLEEGAILQRKPLASGQRRVSLRIGIRCSTPGYQQECFPHSASCAFISSSLPPPLYLPPSLPPFHPVLRLFTCITFAERTREKR